MSTFCPKTIAREFIRQYYTILSKSPKNLHCFYHENSVFDHDSTNGERTEKDTSIVGKTAISHVMKEYAAHYENCCTIVSSIETTSTLNDGLVIQVFGEISRNDNEVRPFCQTFVLAPVTPFKYYIHNDIFRYQDIIVNEMITADSEVIKKRLENDMRSSDDEFIVSETNAEEMEIEAVATTNIESEKLLDAKSKIIDCQTLEVGQCANKQQRNDENNNEICESVADFMALARLSAEEKKERSTSLVAEEDNENVIEEDEKEKTDIEQKEETNIELEINIEQEPEQEPEKEPEQKKKTNNDEKEVVKLPKEEKVVEKCVEPIAINENEKKTYADFLKFRGNRSDSVESNGYSKPNNSNPSLSDSKQKRKTSNASISYKNIVKDKALGSRNTLDQKDQRPITKSKSIFFFQTQILLIIFHTKMTLILKLIFLLTVSSSSTSGDNLQVFIGNISHQATEKELRTIFEKYGKIARFRIHTNAMKEWLPYYAFVTYETMDSVRKCLAEKV